VSETARRLDVSFHARPWGTSDLGPWFPKQEGQIGEVWLTSEPPLPLLVKFIFTTEALSVQVHPSGEGGKTEMWYILDAVPGAALALGFREPVTPARLRESAISGEILSLLDRREARKGDVIFVPGGAVHALGPGLRLLEIQQNCDITYRLYDYNRGRPLHLDEGAAVALLGPAPPPPAVRRLDERRTLLAACEYFVTELWEIQAPFSAPPPQGTSHILIALEGAGTLNGEQYSPGEAWLIPNGTPVEVQPRAHSQMISTYAPAKLGRLG